MSQQLDKIVYAAFHEQGCQISEDSQLKDLIVRRVDELFVNKLEAQLKSKDEVIQGLMEALKFYGSENNYESVYEDDEMDLNRLLDREDVCLDDDDKCFGYAGVKARQSLEWAKEKMK